MECFSTLWAKICSLLQAKILYEDITFYDQYMAQILQKARTSLKMARSNRHEASGIKKYWVWRFIVSSCVIRHLMKPRYIIKVLL